MAKSNFNNYNPEKKNKPIKQSDINFLCQCQHGHIFDYRKRILYTGEDTKYYAPCQGKCPVCGTGEFSFIGSGVNVYPIKFNFVG